MTYPNKILFAIPNFITAGSGRVLANIVEGLDREKFTPTICVSKKGGAIDSELAFQGIQVLKNPFTVDAKPYVGLWGRAKKVAQFFRPYHFDLWHSWHYADDYTEPIIARMAGAKAWVYTKKNMMWGGRAWIVRSLLAKRIIADNKTMPGLFFKRFGLQKKVSVISHGVDPDKFKPIEVNRLSFRRKNQLPLDKVLLGLVAHLLPIKGHDVLIAAAAKCPEIHLLFAGRADDEDYFALLKNRISQQGLQKRVHFMGNVDDVPSFLAQMNIIVLPTKKRGEGCPVSLLEAMACGKACIATDVPGSRDIIEDGVSGVLVPPEDPDSLAKAIRYLAGNSEIRKRLEDSALKRILGKFTVEQEVNHLEKLHCEILQN